MFSIIMRALNNTEVAVSLVPMLLYHLTFSMKSRLHEPSVTYILLEQWLG